MISLDEHAAELLELGRRSPGPSLEALGIAAARIQVDTSLPLLALESEPVAKVVDLRVPAVASVPAFRVRLYWPRLPARGDALPAVVFFHGGGWALCGIDSHDSLCRYLANRSGSVFMSVEYRLAPEHRFPACVEDCLRALEWLAGGAVEGIAVERIAVAGDSAGGNLAAVVAQLAAGRVPLRHQLLMYPVLDSSRRWPAYERYGRGYFLDVLTMDWFASLYQRTRDDRFDPRFSPWLGQRLHEVAGATLLSAGFDINCDAALAYVERLRADGVTVSALLYPSLPHGFASMAGYIPAARTALDDGARALQAALTSPGRANLDRMQR